MELPAWKDMPDHEKFEFLNKWCSNLSAAVDRHSAELQGLHERLRKVEATAAGKS